MNKMREKTGVVLWILVAAFGGLWVLQDSGFFDAITGGRGAGSPNVAVVDGEPITAELFNNRVQQQEQAYGAQGVEVTNALRQQIQTQAYDEFITNAIVERQMDKLGIGVTDDEVFQLINGETPDPLIAQVFSDGAGGVNRQQLAAAVASTEPQVVQELSAIEEQVRSNRRRTKLQALVSAAVRVSDAEVDAEFVRRTRTASARAVALRYADVPDAQVQVSDADLRAYYDAHTADYERPKTWAVEFVSFDKAPTRADSARAIGELRGVAAPFASAADPAAYANQNGGIGAAAFAPASDLNPALAAAVYSDLRVGRVVGPVIAGDQAVMARITGVRPSASPLVHARHILLPPGQEAAAAALKARIVSGQISFADAARAASTDESNKAQGGDLGWFGRGRMVSEFDAAAFAAPVGQVVGPVKTSFGVHLILVEGTSTQEAELVQIARPVQANVQAVSDAADDFVAINLEEEGQEFAAAAGEKNLTVTPLEIQEDQPYIPSLDVGRELTRFLQTASVGDHSAPLDAGTGFAVVHVTGITDAGTAPFDDVRDQIETDVALEKKKKVVTDRLAAATTPTASLAAIAAAVGQTPVDLPELSMATPTVPGFGEEPRMVGAAFGLMPGQRSGVVEGEQAAFVVQTVSLRGGLPAELTPALKTQIREELLQRRRQQVAQAWIKALRDNADVEDLRTRAL